MVCNGIFQNFSNEEFFLVCPQFDVLWDILTPKEHVLFYARLKGVPPKEEEEHVVSKFNYPNIIRYLNENFREKF